MIRPDEGLEPTIYHTQGKHANHYTTHVVQQYEDYVIGYTWLKRINTIYTFYNLVFETFSTEWLVTILHVTYNLCLEDSDSQSSGSVTTSLCIRPLSNCRHLISSSICSSFSFSFRLVLFAEILMNNKNISKHYSL